MFSNILGGAAGFPVADLGDTVQHSLRFNRNQWLASPAVTLSTYTASIWLKLGRIRNPTVSGGVTQIIIGTAGTGGHGVGFSNNKLYSTHTGDESTEEFRDPSGWYHLVINSTGNLYINGVAIATGGGLHDPSNEEIVLGHIWPQNSQNSTYAFEGLLANYHFIDGQELTPTSFGRTNEDGVWVPENYTGTYGTNGARLIFDSSAGIGNDTSGNNNDYTVGGTFDTTDVGLYSPGLTANSGGTMNSLANAFNGDTGTAAFVSPTGIGMTFSPATDIPFTSLEIFPSNNNMSATFDGTTTNTPTLQYTQVATNGTINSTTPLTINVGSGLNCNLNAIRINGSTVLIDNSDNDVDYNDTPTSNYATYNSLVNNDPPTLAGANLDATAINNGLVWSTQELPNKHLYAEFIRDGASDRFAAGVGNADDGFEVGAASDNDYAFMIVYSEFGGNNRIYNESTTHSQTGLTAYNTGDVLGVEWRGDLATRQVNFYINGTQVGSSENVAAGGTYHFAVQRAGGSNPPEVLANFGQMPFIAAPTGVSNTTHGMQTNNLPEPTIKNGKEHFEAIIWDGNDVDDRAITTTEEFAPDLVWIKCRDSVINHFIYDTVRSAPNRLFSNLTNEEDAGAGHLKSFTSTGFTLGTSGNVNGTGNEYVAWCWKAGGTAVSNTDGTITSNVSANTDAGFSIVSYTGNSTNDQTIGHGLSSAPELVIYKNRDDSTEWYIYHKDLPQSGSFLEYLKFTSAAATTAGGGIDEHPDANVLKVNNNGMTNGTTSGGTGQDMIAYCWHSVEGFSKFGSYTANNDADGPVIYLGFKPQFIMIKSATHSSNWHIYDSARDPFNRTNKRVFHPNSSAAEKDDADERLDFLSNGFKLRSVDNDNVGSNTYIYMAFAEHPFGGENAAPATAQ